MWSLLFMTMIANAIFFGTDGSEARPIGVEVGIFRFTLSQIVIAAICMVIVVPINIIIVTLFKRARPKLMGVQKDEHVGAKECDECDLGEKDGKGMVKKKAYEEFDVIVKDSDSGTEDNADSGIGEKDNVSRTTIDSQTKLVKNLLIQLSEADLSYDHKNDDNRYDEVNKENDKVKQDEEEELPKPIELFNRIPKEKVNRNSFHKYKFNKIHIDEHLESDYCFHN